MSPAGLPDVRVGDVWKDRDKRGGPTFRVTAVLPQTGQVLVENTNGAARPRSIKLARFRSDYELDVRHGWDPDR